MARKSNILLETGTNELEIIEFILEYPDECGKPVAQPFGINVAKVREIIRLPEFTRWPHLHDSLLGIFRLRDQLIPALDLVKWLYKHESVLDNQKMIISEINQIRIGFLVNGVRRIHRISWTQIEPPEALENQGLANSAIVGVLKLEQRLIMMIDIEKILVDIKPQLGMQHLDPALASPERGRKIMVVEDSPTVRDLLENRLVDAGFTISAFNNGRAAWDALRRIAARVKGEQELYNEIELVITDIEMPVMDGYTLTRHIKEHELLRALPVMIFSSMITEDARHKGESVGADAQLSKPQVTDLIKTLDKLLSPRGTN